MSTVTLTQDLASALPGINLKWVYTGLGTIKELSLVYFKNTDDADIVSKDIPSGCMKYNLPSGFDSGQSYSFQLQVLDLSGNMAYSSSLVVVAPWFLQPPEIESVSGGDQSLLVHLLPTSNVVSSSDTTVEFVIKRADNVAFWIIKPFSSSGDYTLSASDNSALVNNTSYRICCMFQPEDNNSRYNAPSAVSSSVTATPSNLPNIPQSCSIQSVGTTDYSIRVDWTRPDDFAQWSGSGYSVVLRCHDSTGGDTYVNLTNDSALNYTFSGLVAGKGFVFYVKYVNQYGAGPELCNDPNPSPSYLTPTRIPGAPIRVSEQALDSYVILQWYTPSDIGQSAITSYKIYKDGNYLASVAGNVTSYNGATGLTNGTTYSFTVTAVNAIGESALMTPAWSLTPAGSMSIVSVVVTGKTVTAVIKPNGYPIQSVMFLALDSDPDDIVDGSFMVNVPQANISQITNQNITVVKTFSSFSSDIDKWAVIAHNAVNSAYLDNL